MEIRSLEGKLESTNTHEIAVGGARRGGLLLNDRGRFLVNLAEQRINGALLLLHFHLLLRLDRLERIWLLARLKICILQQRTMIGNAKGRSDNKTDTRH